MFTTEEIKELKELIGEYNLEEDLEHIIVSYTDTRGKKWKCFILKRRYIRIVYSEERFIDYPLAHVIRATIQHPELLLSEALLRFYEETGEPIPNVVSDEQGPASVQHAQHPDGEEML